MLQQEQLLKVDRPCPDPDPKVAAESAPPPPATYQMRPTQTFKSEKIKQIIGTVLNDTLSGKFGGNRKMGRNGQNTGSDIFHALII